MRFEYFRKTNRLPSFAALLGIVVGAVCYFLMPRAEGYLPIPTLQGGILSSLLASYAKETGLLFLAALAFRTVRHPLPILLFEGLRGFYFALSSLQTVLYAPPLTAAVYLLLHSALLLAHIAAGIAALTYTKRTGLFPFLYFTGLIVLLTTVRLLAFTLILG